MSKKDKLNFEVSEDGRKAKLTGSEGLDGVYIADNPSGGGWGCAGCDFYDSDPYICAVAKCEANTNVFGKPIVWQYKEPLETPKETLSKRHRHADLMIQYANDCTLPVWVRCAKDECWLSSESPAWYEDYEYAIGEKPKDVKLMKYPNGTIEFYAPESKEPKKNTRVYYIDFNKVSTETWNGSMWCEIALAKGIVHLTRENAELHQEALMEFHTNLFNKEHPNYYKEMLEKFDVSH